MMRRHLRGETRSRLVASTASRWSLSRSALFVRLLFEIWGSCGRSRCVYASAAAPRWSGAPCAEADGLRGPRTRCSPDPRKRGYCGPRLLAARDSQAYGFVCSDGVSRTLLAAPISPGRLL
ncbi:unnamed protein product [Pelagomonas calceolata]|uniref:Uncharacterized protein n=1 Tax=Pelagomonas calceolata TaxID=35677 RepID=A0A8J2WNE9_9STRA|nr:unnamed protein product [Pelagomonas calceolata]